jgi:hypothetical protein
MAAWFTSFEKTILSRKLTSAQMKEGTHLPQAI